MAWYISRRIGKEIDLMNTRKITSYAMSFLIGAGLGAAALLPCIMRIIENVMR